MDFKPWFQVIGVGRPFKQDEIPESERRIVGRPHHPIVRMFFHHSVVVVEDEVGAITKIGGSVH